MGLLPPCLSSRIHRIRFHTQSAAALATIGHWNQDGLLFEEHLFRDHAEFLRPIGLSH